MAGKAVIRTLLILALIVTAHAIKPFSIKSVTQHFLYSTKSFKFVLPERLRDNFDHANYLAINLSNSLFEAGDRVQGFAKDVVAKLDSLAIDVQPLEDVNKSATKQKPRPKRSAPPKRVIKPERGGVPDLIASVNSDDILSPESPLAPTAGSMAVVLPVVQPSITETFNTMAFFIAPPRPIGALMAPRKSDCGNREPAPVRLIALIEDAKRLKAAVEITARQAIEKAIVSASECEEQGAEVVAEEIEVEATEPEEIVAPQAIEEQAPSALSMPIEKCTKEP